MLLFPANPAGHERQPVLEIPAVLHWAPKHLTDLFGLGFHLHFVSDDKTFSAHVQNFITENLEIEIGKITKIDQEFPDDDENFDQHLFQ